MNSSDHAESTAPTNYAPSVPMSVYRELAAELRANKAMIDSLTSRNQQLVQQNQFLKQEIHNVVQAALSLGQVAGVARPTTSEAGSQVNVPANAPANGIAPNVIAQFVRNVSNRQDLSSAAAYETLPPQVAATQPMGNLAGNPAEGGRPHPPQSPNVAPLTPHKRVPRPIAAATAQGPDDISANAVKLPAAKPATMRQQARQQPRQHSSHLTYQTAARQKKATMPGKGNLAKSAAKLMPQPANQLTSKLFTEQSGQYRSSVLDSQSTKDIGGIWLVLSIILIIVTAFGAGFLIMKPLLNDR